MDFSKLKLNEGLAQGVGAMSSLNTSQATTQLAKDSAMDKTNRANINKTRKSNMSSQPAGTKQKTQTMMNSYDHFVALDQRKAAIKQFNEMKSDWRAELQEKVMDGNEENNHPYVNVMPTGDENLMQAVKQMRGEVDKKKEKAQGQMVQMGEAVKGKKDAAIINNEEFKAHDPEKVKAKADKKSKSNDPSERMKGHTMRAVNNLMTKADYYEKEDQDKADDQMKKHMSDAEKHTQNYKKSKSKSDADKAYTSAGRFKTLKMVKKAGKQFEEFDVASEETLTEAKKKKCKEGYKRDENGNCVKETKKKTTIVYGGRWGYGHHHHHDDENDDGSNADNGSDAGDGGGGMGEMFDYLGNELFTEMSRMHKMKAEYDSALKKPSPFENMSQKQKEQMTKATKSTRNVN